jgi:hypothetical protein
LNVELQALWRESSYSAPESCYDRGGMHVAGP